MSDHGHGHEEHGHGKSSKKSKKAKALSAKAKTVILSSMALAIGFLQATSSFYLREVFSIKTFTPSWGFTKSEIVFKGGDILVLKEQMALRILNDSNLLAAEQARQIAVLALIIALVYFIGKNIKERASLFLFVAGLAGVSYHVFLFYFLRWPKTLLAKDVMALFPVTVIVPVYMSVLLCALALIGGTYLVFKKS